MRRIAIATGIVLVVALFLLIISLVGGISLLPSGNIASTVKGDNIKILVFSKTGAFRHESIKDGIAALRKLATEHHVSADFTEDASLFNDRQLAQYKAVVFLMTSGNILNDRQKRAFERYIEHGGGYAGVHSASDTEYNWPWYGKLVGAYFLSHPHIAQATINVSDTTHVSTSMLPAHWTRVDEWYNFRSNPRANVHVLLTLDETSYQGGTMGHDHPVAWYHTIDHGRAWYTALGHTTESYREPLFLEHLWGGIMYAAGQKP
ncbi:MAG: ThuA domain-containing protein [Ktedonobacteraceae bacterium]|nr:ThuA domain-containing protein [Ktedonobacteraceae bacterium]